MSIFHHPCSSSMQEMSSSIRPLYLDAQATTPLDPRVLDSMLPFMTSFYGNPHSRTHKYGWESEDAMEEARKVTHTYSVTQIYLDRGSCTNIVSILKREASSYRVFQPSLEGSTEGTCPRLIPTHEVGKLYKHEHRRKYWHYFLRMDNPPVGWPLL